MEADLWVGLFFLAILPFIPESANIEVACAYIKKAAVKPLFYMVSDVAISGC